MSSGNWSKGKGFIVLLFFLLTFMLLVPAGTNAALVMPDFADIPTDWVTDRYEPHSFTNVGTYQGRDNVLGIEINEADGYTNRPSGYQTTFYNTQGRKHVISGGAGSALTAALYIPSSWVDEANGTVRSDVWGVLTDGTQTSGYPIIGFTNYEGEARYRAWEDSDTGGWVDLTTPVSYDTWTAFAIVFTGSSYEYYINGLKVFTDTTVEGSTGFSAVIMQAYNFFDDPTLTSATPINYTAYWSNSTVVPVPGAIWLLGSGLLGLGVLGWRRKKG